MTEEHVTELIFDRDGNPISFDEWAQLWSSDRAAKGYRRVGADTVNDAAGREHRVSTVWLGLNHQFTGPVQLIFETMVFCHHDAGCDWTDRQWRYSTEEQAREGHNRTIVRVAESRPRRRWLPLQRLRPKAHRGE